MVTRAICPRLLSLGQWAPGCSRERSLSSRPQRLLNPPESLGTEVEPNPHAHCTSETRQLSLPHPGRVTSEEVRVVEQHAQKILQPLTPRCAQAIPSPSPVLSSEWSHSVNTMVLQLQPSASKKQHKMLRNSPWHRCISKLSFLPSFLW
jgi:hypothetical protein